MAEKKRRPCKKLCFNYHPCRVLVCLAVYVVGCFLRMGEAVMVKGCISTRQVNPLAAPPEPQPI